jgi:hypothetical protein
MVSSIPIGHLNLHRERHLPILERTIGGPVGGHMGIGALVPAQNGSVEGNPSGALSVLAGDATRTLGQLTGANEVSITPQDPELHDGAHR